MANIDDYDRALEGLDDQQPYLLEHSGLGDRPARLAGLS
jgi:hypothetical protein